MGNMKMNKITREEFLNLMYDMKLAGIITLEQYAIYSDKGLSTLEFKEQKCDC
jgi:hypothetical protein